MQITLQPVLFTEICVPLYTEGHARGLNTDTDDVTSQPDYNDKHVNKLRSLRLTCHRHRRGEDDDRRHREQFAPHVDEGRHRRPSRGRNYYIRRRTDGGSLEQLSKRETFSILISSVTSYTPFRPWPVIAVVRAHVGPCAEELTCTDYFQSIQVDVPQSSNNIRSSK